MSLNPISKPFVPKVKRESSPPLQVVPGPEVELPSVELLREAPSDKQVAPPPPVAVQEPEPLKSDQFEPRVLTFEEVCRYLNLKPEARRFFVNKRGEYVRKLVEEYVWTVDQEKKVHKIPKWFIEGGLQ
jgi:hypothetical protein